MMKDSENLSHQAYNEIKKMIMNGIFKPGEVISINALTHILEISRTPITNACQKLEYEKFLKILPKQGVLIQTLTIDDAREIYELRAAVETYAANKSYAAIGEDDLIILRESLRLQKEYASQKDIYNFMQEDTKFHKFLLNKYDNESFSSILQVLFERAFIAGLRSGEIVGRLDENIREHEQIIQALENKDKGQFIESLETNIINGFKNLMTHRLSS